MEQIATCQRYGAKFDPPADDMKAGVALNVRERLQPLNGLRHPPEGDTSGWYIWAGEGDPSEDPEFFQPLHIKHLHVWCPELVRLLALPPGWRFLIADNHEDVWEDPTLLNP
ncbi:immunity protein Imm33 domain-containing protein [Chondromyces crocatus]|uniref:immunity protein Imm33 domain-containing protein n=1 Tax=Chondromyces crocatus TaxID=52 RepID=UPI001FDECEE5|nr:hypothetical protein [Chondromyces crocatus]